MTKRQTSRNSDNTTRISSKSDTSTPVLGVLRETRLNRHLTQEALARKLGIRQRQISDLERSAMDPRLSTIQDVARALDLELMLIPRHLISTIEGLQRTAAGADQRPMYALDEAESDLGDEPRVEVGGTGGARDPATPRRRRPKGSR